MKVEALVDLINGWRGKWPAGERPGMKLTHDRHVLKCDFDDLVKELSEAAWIPDPDVSDCLFAKPIYIDKISPVIDEPEPESSGGSCGYYKCKISRPTTEPRPYTSECNDLIEALDMTYAEANIFKEIWRTCAARKGKSKEGHQATRGAEKVLFFAVRNAIQKGADVSRTISDINQG